MSTFIMASLGLVLGVLVYLWWQLSRPVREQRAQASQTNKAIFHEREQELAALFQSGAITQEEKIDLEAENARRLLNEVNAESVGQERHAFSNKSLVLALAVLVPLITVGLYRYLGAYPQVAHWQNLSAAEMQHGETNMRDALLMLRTRLQHDPDDVEGWFMLGRSYMSLDRPMEAMQAFSNAHRIDREEVEYIVAYAQSLRMVDSEGGLPEVDRLLAQALVLNPEHEGARILTAYRSLEKAEFQKAIEGFEWIKSRRVGESETIAMLDGLIAQARSALGQGVVETGTTQANSAVSQLQQAIQVTVQINDSLENQIPQGSKLFVYAKAETGPAFPVAVVAIDAPTFPLSVSLSDQNAMNESFKLSGQKRVVLVARLSQSGKVEPKSGDLEGLTAGFDWRAAPKQTVIINTRLK